MNRDFDRIFSINVIQFLPNRDAYFAAIHDCLRPGGAAITTYMPRHQGATKRDADRMATAITEAMERVGFRDVQTLWMSGMQVPAAAVIGRR